MDTNLKVFALGGLHEVGKNCYVLEKNEDMIIIDCGVKFLNNNNLVDGVIPDLSYLCQNRQKIKGLFITHGHEDHIGAIPYLLQLIPNIPVYGSEFSISLLKQKLKSEESKEKITIFRDDTVIRTEVLQDNTRIVVTGDFKFDWTEIGEKTDLFKLTEYGKKGVDLLLSDSTNAEVEGNTPSETKVIKRLRNIIFEATGRVIITSFASNVYRLKEIIKIAEESKKKIVLLAAAISKTPNNKLIIFCTGSQVEPGDSIILTSSPIMDNKLNVEIINNKLFELGAKIYENGGENLIHASGHACQEDLRLMLKLVNPTYFMPFHGDFRMLKKHGHLAKEMGMPEKNIFVCQNGEVVEAKVKELESSIEIRKKMSRGGLILVLIFYDKKKEQLAEPPYIFTYGFINMKKHGDLIDGWKNKINEQVKSRGKDLLLVEELKKYVENEFEKKVEDLKKLQENDSKVLFKKFLEILRVNSVSDKSNAFDKLINLFVVKVFDEKGGNREFGIRNNPKVFNGLEFQFIDKNDTPESFMRRISDLYKGGMEVYFKKEITGFLEYIEIGNLKENEIKGKLKTDSKS
ncbi:10964_t:CDS:2 [Ambispora leptoticha]|uniref:10964_t:CDS:1 n=1 Tax=Ambispora leptoticha TaxID=144679 RepID=A0A9N8YUN8_9GLOM|nr:10964_t:CDS:2 [Ambispora leptoticha]